MAPPPKQTPSSPQRWSKEASRARPHRLEQGPAGAPCTAWRCRIACRRPGDPRRNHMCNARRLGAGAARCPSWGRRAAAGAVSVDAAGPAACRLQPQQLPRCCVNRGTLQAVAVACPPGHQGPGGEVLQVGLAHCRTAPHDHPYCWSWSSCCCVLPLAAGLGADSTPRPCWLTLTPPTTTTLRFSHFLGLAQVGQPREAAQGVGRCPCTHPRGCMGLCWDH